MAGDPIYPSDCCDSLITNVTCSCTSFSTPIRVNNSSTYYSNYQKEVKPRRTKKMMQSERADKLRHQSFLLLNEVKPNIMKVIGHPFKPVSKPYHKNYALH